jgi:hypothetical protein
MEPSAELWPPTRLRPAQTNLVLTISCFSGFDPSLMAQGSQAIRESSSVLGEGNSLGR